MKKTVILGILALSIGAIFANVSNAQGGEQEVPCGNKITCPGAPRIVCCFNNDDTAVWRYFHIE